MFAPVACWRALAVAVIVSVGFAARAAELDGVPVPDTLSVDGKTLQLNGFGLRTYSLLRLHVYVVALYLEHPSADPDAILRSPETKLLTVKFRRSVSADSARNAWRDGLANNCQPPCRLDAGDVAQFLGQMPAMRAGDGYSLLFGPEGATVTLNGQAIGTVAHVQFAEAMLATFLGPRPASRRLKRELLGSRK